MIALFQAQNNQFSPSLEVLIGLTVLNISPSSMLQIRRTCLPADIFFAFILIATTKEHGGNCFQRLLNTIHKINCDALPQMWACFALSRQLFFLQGISRLRTRNTLATWSVLIFTSTFLNFDSIVFFYLRIINLSLVNFQYNSAIIK